MYMLGRESQQRYAHAIAARAFYAANRNLFLPTSFAGFAGAWRHPSVCGAKVEVRTLGAQDHAAVASFCKNMDMRNLIQLGDTLSPGSGQRQDAWVTSVDRVMRHFERHLALQALVLGARYCDTTQTSEWVGLSFCSASHPAGACEVNGSAVTRAAALTGVAYALDFACLEAAARCGFKTLFSYPWDDEAQHRLIEVCAGKGLGMKTRMVTLRALELVPPTRRCEVDLSSLLGKMDQEGRSC